MQQENGFGAQQVCKSVQTRLRYSNGEANMGMHEKMTGAERVARHRAAKRAQGLRLKQFWLPDLNNPKVREELALEAKEIARRDRKSDIMAEIEELSGELFASLPPYCSGEEPQN
jgi:Protein  of unknown function (DUF3018)